MPPPNPPLTADVEALLGTAVESPFAGYTEQPVCTPDARVTAQVDEDITVAERGWTVENAAAGHLLLCPGGGSGPIATILASLAPPQHYTHMAMFLDADGMLRQATASQGRLNAIDKQPTNGYPEDAVKYAWPGTVTQSWTDAHDSATGGPDAVARLDARTGKSFKGDQISFRPTVVNAGTVDQPKPELRWPLVVRPHPSLTTPAVSDALARVARAAIGVTGHYRFFAYTNGLICRDHEFDGPLQLETRLPKPDSASWYNALAVALSAGTDEQSGIDNPEKSAAVVCSTFIWRAVAAANVAASNSGGPIIVIDGRPEIAHRPVAYVSDLVRQPRDMTGVQYSPSADGMYVYTEAERKRAGDALAESIRRKVADGVAAEDSTEIDVANVAIMLLTPALGLGLLLADGDPAKALFLASSDIIDDVTNQMCNSFANDDSSEGSTDSEAWKQPGTGFSVSPDDIIHNWAPPTSESPKHVHGLYGYNERIKLTPPRLVLAPSRTSWQVSEATIPIEIITVDRVGANGSIEAVSHAAVRVGGVLRCFSDASGHVFRWLDPERYVLGGGHVVRRSRVAVAFAARGGEGARPRSLRVDGTTGASVRSRPGSPHLLPLRQRQSVRDRE